MWDIDSSYSRVNNLCQLYLMSVSLAPENTPPLFLHTTFRQKWGGVCLLEYSVHLVHMPPPSVLVVLNTLKFDNHNDCRSFLKEQQLC